MHSYSNQILPEDVANGVVLPSVQIELLPEGRAVPTVSSLLPRLLRSMH